MSYEASAHPPQRSHLARSQPARARRSAWAPLRAFMAAIVSRRHAAVSLEALSTRAFTSARAEICRTTRDCFDIATGPGRFPCSQLCTPEALAQAASWVADISDGAADHRTALMIKGNSRLHQRRARLSAARRDRWPALSNRSGATLSAISSLAARDLGNAISSAPASICNAIACASGSSGSSSITPPSEAA